MRGLRRAIVAAFVPLSVVSSAHALGPRDVDALPVSAPEAERRVEDAVVRLATGP